MIKSFKQFTEGNLFESSLSRIMKHIKGDRPIGIISASRDRFEPSENKKRNGSLKSDIRSAGFGFVNLKGNFIENEGTPDEAEVSEDSFFVIGKPNENGNLKGLLKKLGVKYDQDSILYKSSDTENAILIGTNTTGFPGKDKEDVLGKWKPNKLGKFFSKMKGDRTFIFEEAVEEMGMLGKWAEYIADKRAND